MAIRQMQERRPPRILWCCCREQGSFAGSEKCVIMETPLIVPLLTPVVWGSLNCFPSDGAEALHRVTMGLHPR